MFDAHDAFPILTLRLLRSRGASDQGVTSPSSPATPDGGGLQSCRGVDASSGVINNGEGDSLEDWSIISGGGDGTVAHLSVVGLASEREAASGVAEAGVELHMIGDYEVRSQIVGGRGCTHSSLPLPLIANGRITFRAGGMFPLAIETSTTLGAKFCCRPSTRREMLTTKEVGVGLV